MIIRRIRPDENGKVFGVRSLGYGFKIDVAKEETILLEHEAIGAFDDDNETLIAMAYIHEYKANYCGKFVPCFGIGEVASLPQYRRSGAVRRIMEEIFKLTEERKWVTSFLYPFSYDYYRKFGYERLVKRMQMKVKSAALSCCERDFNAKLYSYKNKDILKDVLSVYNTYAKEHSSMFLRDEKTEEYSLDPFNSGSHTYVHYSSLGEPDAVAVIRIYDDDRVEVDELCYTDADGLRGMIGFLRTYDGQVKEFIFNNLPSSSELELVISEYSLVKYSEESRAMGRLMLVEEALKKNIYPTDSGHFRLRCEDELPFNRAVFDVTYNETKAVVKKLPFDSEFDISAEIPPLSRFVLEGGYNKTTASFLNGVILKNSSEDFFRAFPKRNLHIHDFF